MNARDAGRADAAPQLGRERSGTSRPGNDHTGKAVVYFVVASTKCDEPPATEG